MSTSLCVVGDFAWDVLIRTNNNLLKGGDSFGEVMLTPGGSAANLAVWAKRCGLNTRFIGKIGRDRFGQLAREDLEKEKIEYLKTAYQYSPDNLDKTVSSAYFYDMVFLFGEERK